MRLSALAPATFLDVSIPGIRVVPLAGGVWRVTSVRTGAMLGHIESVALESFRQLESVGDEGGRRYRAKRFVVRERRFRVIGEFWNPADAVDAVRFD